MSLAALALEYMNGRHIIMTVAAWVIAGMDGEALQFYIGKVFANVVCDAGDFRTGKQERFAGRKDTVQRNGDKLLCPHAQAEKEVLWTVARSNRNFISRLCIYDYGTAAVII